MEDLTLQCEEALYRSAKLPFYASNEQDITHFSHFQERYQARTPSRSQLESTNSDFQPRSS